MPNLLAYDPAFAFEIAVIIQDGIRRMYVNGESIFYYLTVGNEPLHLHFLQKGNKRVTFPMQRAALIAAILPA